MGSDNRQKQDTKQLGFPTIILIALAVATAVYTVTSLTIGEPSRAAVKADIATVRGAVRGLAEPAVLAEPVKPVTAAAVRSASARPASEDKKEVIAAAETLVETLRQKARSLKRGGAVMEEDPAALKVTAELQEASRRLLLLRYGEGDSAGRHRVHIHLRFPLDSMPDADGAEGRLEVETAPISLMPHAVLTFLEIVRGWQGGAFHRNAGHVLQVMVNDRSAKGLAFQEYSPRYPHVKHTLGFAGRPGGPAFYISTIDNTRNHGPGSQGSQTEADSCFGRIVSGFDVVARLNRVWGHRSKGFKMDRMGFLEDPAQYVQIKSMSIIDG